MADRRPTRRPARARAASGSNEKDAPLTREVNLFEVTVDIRDLSEIPESINVGVFGPSGHGKTALVTGAPERKAIIACEPGIKAARMAGHSGKVLWSPDWPHIEASKAWCDKELGPGDWCLFDSGTKAQELYIQWLLSVIHAENPSRDIDIPALQDHQKWQRRFKRFMDSLVNAPYNTIVVFGDKSREDEDGEQEVKPNIVGGRHNEVCNYVIAQFDVFLYYAISPSTGERRAISQQTGPYWAKDRYGAVSNDDTGRFYDVPDDYYGAMADMIELIQEAKPIDQVQEDPGDKDLKSARPVRSASRPGGNK